MNKPTPASQFQSSVKEEALGVLSRLGVPSEATGAKGLPARSPITGEIVTHVRETSPEEAKDAIRRAADAFLRWRRVPAPRRGEFVRLLGEELRAAKPDLGRLVTLETGKILSEGVGEVQEMIDICDFAVGLSRQLYGLTIATERADHRMMEVWHPLGVCGDPVVWKPSEKTPLTALATQALVRRAMGAFGDAPEGLSEVLIGNQNVG